MTTYKVMWRTSKGLESLCKSPISVTYVPNEWVAPHIAGSKLFVFTSLATAVNYLSSHSIEIWECDTESLAEPAFTQVMTLLDTQTTSDWWNNGYKIPIGVATGQMVPDTMVANRVKLTTQIKAALKPLG